MKRKHRVAALLMTGLLTFSLLGSAAATTIYTDLSNLAPWGREAISYVTAHGLMNGTDSHTFAPEEMANRAMAATLIWRIAGQPQDDTYHIFWDVPEGEWYSSAIDWASSQGVINGYERRFLPFETVTRQDLVVMLYRYAGSPTADISVLSWFEDYNQVSSYAANALAWAVDCGILNGDGQSLLPRAGATRVQMAAIVARFHLRYPAETTPTEENQSTTKGLSPDASAS